LAENLVMRDDADAVRTLTLNDPGRLNALSESMITGLAAAFADTAEDASVRVVVLRGAGRAFCAGHDLREMTAARMAEDGGRAHFAAQFERTSRLMLSIPRLPQPVIAEVHGIATAAGCQLAASCDLVVAAEGTRFGVNGVDVGLFCSTPMVALTRVMGRKRTFELLVTGEFVEAEEARELGLVNRVVPAEALGAATRALAATIAGKLGPALRIGKRAFYDQAELPVDQAYELAGKVMAENMMLDETAEGISAFLEKRRPGWQA
jgi:enoyl-CoA hydratase/carnithine racemase